MASTGATPNRVTRSAARAWRTHASASRYRFGTNRPAMAEMAAITRASAARRSGTFVRLPDGVVMDFMVSLLGVNGSGRQPSRCPASDEHDPEQGEVDREAEDQPRIE